MLSEVVHRASGMPADTFADRYLFAPLGITAWSWERLRDETVNAGSGLQLRPRDMAKIGQLVLEGGRWRGRQIVGSAWVRTFTEPRVRDHTFRRRGRALPAYSAEGRGGQVIEEDLELRRSVPQGLSPGRAINKFLTKALYPLAVRS